MKKIYWWTKIPHTQRKRKKSNFELLREFVYFYRSDQFLDYEVANTINTYLINPTVGGFFEITNKNTLMNFCAYVSKTVDEIKLGYLMENHVIEFLKTYEEDILVDKSKNRKL